MDSKVKDEIAATLLADALEEADKVFQQKTATRNLIIMWMSVMIHAAMEGKADDGNLRSKVLDIYTMSGVREDRMRSILNRIDTFRLNA